MCKLKFLLSLSFKVNPSSRNALTYLFQVLYRRLTVAFIIRLLYLQGDLSRQVFQIIDSYESVLTHSTR